MRIAITDACIFIDIYELQLTTDFFFFGFGDSLHFILEF